MTRLLIWAARVRHALRSAHPRRAYIASAPHWLIVQTSEHDEIGRVWGTGRVSLHKAIVLRNHHNHVWGCK